MFHGVVKLLPTLLDVIKSPAKKSYFAKSSKQLKPRFFHAKKRRNGSAKSFRGAAAKLAVALISVGYLLGYQPTISSFPPFRQSIVRADFEQTQTVNPKSADIEFKLPHPGYVSTYFSTFHPGVDIASGLGMPLHAVAKGVVTSTGINFWGLGLVIEIDHGHGYKSLYAHLGKTYVKPGQEVNPEDIIGEVGLTGHTSGPHTHLELSKDGQNFNPLAVLPKIPDIAVAWGTSGVASSSAKLSSK